MLSGAETPRPLPPAKARRATMLKLSSTPPPAYNSPFTLPSRRQSRQDILGSPMEATLRMMGWDSDTTQSSSSPSLKEGHDWMKEKSREELQELLVRADGLIKEREHEFDLNSVTCDNLYENTAALKSEHEFLLSQNSSSSLAGLPHMLPRTMNFSTSDSVLSVIASPHPSLLRRLDQKISADISSLADQNAELMDKLEKLEAGASSADQAGRREVKRLEKEISFLREAFEKTQAKSEELEEKVHDAVTGEAWRKKQEREAKFRSMRRNGRDVNRQENGSKVESFAPDGSRFGGPSEAFSFFPTATSPDFRHAHQIGESNSEMELELSGLFPPPEHALISQLLAKVQELEGLNAQILKQQNETATQLSAVQRDTEQITKAYESWVDPPQPESDVAPSERKGTSSPTRTVKIKSIGRNLDAQSLEGEGNFVARQFTSTAKDRKSVMGLFPEDHPHAVDNSPKLKSDNLQLPSRPSSPWTENPLDRLSWSSAGSRGHESPGALSPLHFFSPATQVQELSPLESRPTLQSELSKELGDSWDMSPSAHHGRTSSLYDLSQFSVPATPSPASRAISRRASDELDFEALKNGGLFTSLPMAAGLLRLSVEPPTPIKAEDTEEYSGEYSRSPRVQRMSETLRSRTGHWVNRRFKEGHQSAKTTSVQSNGTGSRLAEPPGVGLPQRLSNAIDTMIEKFDGLSDDATSTSPPDDNALQLHVASRPRKETETKKNVLGNLLFEVWLWFQFAIIIFVFIYAMAKRGPKVVLVDAERKRSVASAT